MGKKATGIPAISPEITFVGKYMDEVEAITDEGTTARPSIANLTKKVSDRADTDVLELLGEMTQHLDCGVQGMLRIDWGKYPKLGDWDVEVEFYNAARGPRKKLGLVGLLVGDAQRAKAGGCMKYVYILHSISVPGRYYTGMTADLRTRLAKHNAGAVPHTSKFKPWQLKTYLAFSDEKRGLAFEKYLKSASGRAFAKKQL